MGSELGGAGIRIVELGLGRTLECAGPLIFDFGRLIDWTALI